MDAPSPVATPAVRVENLTKLFQVSLRQKYVVAVEGLSLTVNPGEVYGLIGPNGSGKSTTMKVVLGLMAPTKGRTSIFGVDSRNVRSRRDVGFLPENPYFYKHLTGSETLRFYGRLCGLKGRNLKDRIVELLEMVDLTAAADRRLAGYSKGMLQRIGLAQAVIHRPRLVILDEPTAGVDPTGSRKIRDLILQLKEQGISVMLCSHLLEQVQEVCDQVGIISKGKMVKEGPLKDLIAVEDETEIVLKNATPELISDIRSLVERHAGSKVVRTGHPNTTLERLFLEQTRSRPGDQETSLETEEKDS